MTSPPCSDALGDRAGRICTATPTARTSRRCSRCATRSGCARWCSMAPIRSTARTTPGTRLRAGHAREVQPRLRALAGQCRALPGNSMDHIAPGARAAARQHLCRPGAPRREAQRPPSRPMPAQLAIVMFGSAPGLRHRARDRCRRARLRRPGTRRRCCASWRKPRRGGLARSDALAGAIQRRTCGGRHLRDPPQIFDMSLPPSAAPGGSAICARSRRRAEAPDTYAPFTHRRVPPHAAGLRLHRSVRALAAARSGARRRCRSCPMRPTRRSRCWWSPASSTT